METIGYSTPFPTFDGLAPDVIAVDVRVSDIVSSKHETSNVAARDAVELRNTAAVNVRVENFGAFECSNTGASELGMIASGGESEDCPWIKALRSQSVLYSQFDGHQQSLIHLLRKNLIRQLKELFDFLHADLRSRGTTAHHEVDEVSDDLAVMVQFNWTRLESLTGGKGDKVSDKGAVGDISMVFKERSDGNSPLLLELPSINSESDFVARDEDDFSLWVVVMIVPGGDVRKRKITNHRGSLFDFG